MSQTLSETLAKTLGTAHTPDVLRNFLMLPRALSVTMNARGTRERLPFASTKNVINRRTKHNRVG